MSSLMKCFVVVFAALVLPACSQDSATTTVELNSTISSSLQASQKRKTACVSFQGNGVYFSSHVGALIALLENNFEPVFATGGSSGAICV